MFSADRLTASRKRQRPPSTTDAFGLPLNESLKQVINIPRDTLTVLDHSRE